MKKFVTICALVTALALNSGCRVSCTDSSVGNRPSTHGKLQPGESSTFNYEPYTIKKGAKVNTSEFGKLMSSQEGEIDLYAGGKERGLIEMYDFDGNEYPDVVVMKRANGEIVSLGLDYGSKNYDGIKEMLGERVTLFHGR